MRKPVLLIFVLLFLYTSSAYGDVPPHYCLRVTVVSKHKQVTGYFSVIGHDLTFWGDEGCSYYDEHQQTLVKLRGKKEKNGERLVVDKSEMHFFSYLLTILDDTVSLYPDVLFIPFPEEGQVAAYAGTRTKIPKNEIQSLVVHTVDGCTVLYSAETELDRQDTWVTGKKYGSDNLWAECNYHAFYYTPKSAQALALVKQFHQLIQKRASLGETNDRTPGDYEEIQRQIKLTVKQLKLHRVVVVGSCWC